MDDRKRCSSSSVREEPRVKFSTTSTGSHLLARVRPKVGGVPSLPAQLQVWPITMYFILSISFQTKEHRTHTSYHGSRNAHITRRARFSEIPRLNCAEMNNKHKTQLASYEDQESPSLHVVMTCIRTMYMYTCICTQRCAYIRPCMYMCTYSLNATHKHTYIH